ncbi:MAG: cation transporter [Clostridia bacterium]|nr:cation transporter [Clostridia bacterium]
MKKVFKIEVDCAVCAQKCEEAIKKVDGVKDCQINFMTQKMTLEADDIDAILKTVEKTAKKIEPDFEIEK